MTTATFTPSRSRIVDLLRQVAPFSVVDAGIRLANDGNVLESSRLESQICGLVRSAEGSAHHRSIILSSLAEDDRSAGLEPTSPHHPDIPDVPVLALRA